MSQLAKSLFLHMRDQFLKSIWISIVLLQAIALSPTCPSSRETENHVVYHISQLFDLLSEIIVSQVGNSIQSVSVCLYHYTNFRILNHF